MAATTGTPSNTKVTETAAANTSVSQKAAAPVSGSPPFPNVLHDFSSYNYVFTLSALSTSMVNSGNYRKNFRHQPGSIEFICRSGSGFPDDRQETAAGKFEFFIDNVKIKSVVGLDKQTKNTNATGITFTVTEPYSMGLFYQSILVASQSCGAGNYVTASYLLSIEFMGHKSADQLNIKIENATKHLAMRIFKIEMSVTSTGAVYEVSAFPWNEQAYISHRTEFTTDISIKGKTVRDLVEGDDSDNQKTLRYAVEQRLKKFAEKNGDSVPDMVSFTFPPDSGADPFGPKENDNDIAKAIMGFDSKRTAMSGMGRENDVYNTSTGTFDLTKINTNPTIAEFKFSQGNDVISALNQIILMSEYARTALDNVDKNGMVNWWRVEAEYREIDQYLKSDGTFPVLTIYKIIPYKVHISAFTPPNTKLPGKENLEKQALKEYNYIYTGKNTDVLEFNIKIDAGFYVTLPADSGVEAGDRRMTSQASNSATNKPVPDKLPITAGDGWNTEMPTRLHRATNTSSQRAAGGGGLHDYASIAAAAFFDAVSSPASMVQLDLTILGDPYFLGDSGLGNYSAPQSEYANMTADGGINWQNGEVDIIVNFRTPIDPDLTTGMYSFPKGNGANRVVEQVSGLYKVYALESIFNQGKFTQQLNLLRRSHQYSKNEEGTPVMKQNMGAETKPN